MKNVYLNYIFSLFLSYFLIASIFCYPFLNFDKMFLNQIYSDKYNSFFSDKIFFPNPNVDSNNSQINNLIRISYTPINNISQQGNDFTISDSLTVSHPFSLTLNSSNGNSSSFDISGITDYSVDSLHYNMTVKSSKDYYIVEDYDKKNQKIDDAHRIIAQGFDIFWDYAGFSGAKIYLDVEGPSLGSDEIEIYVVKPDSSGLPNMTDILSYEMNGPYNSTHMIPFSSSGNFAYFNFTYAILERGSYFLVINRTSDDGGDDFIWWANDDVDNYVDYKFDGNTWKSEGRDYDLILELKETDQYGNPKIYTLPESVSLQDNSQDITSFTQIISTTGIHTLTANNSIDVICNNSYIFTQNFIASSSYQAFNSSYYDYNINWNVDWFSPIVDFSPYSNPFRINSIITPKDWNNISFLFLLNSSLYPGGYRSTDGYVFNLEELISSNFYFESNITLTTTSPNYLFNLILNSEIFDLGFWTYNDTYAVGHNGSLITADIVVKERIDKNILSGELNFTLFDVEGKIVKRKLASYTNISYTDKTDYSLLNSTQVSSGMYSVGTYFDPSLNESDIAGYWTVSSFWQNGTEVGFYSTRIVVQKPTSAKFRWEVLPGSDVWTNNTDLTITRINGDELKLNITYYDISEPFFNESGYIISGASVFYNTDWDITDFLSFQTSIYNGSISTIAPAGNYIIQLTATGLFLEAQTVQFNLCLFHQFRINQHQTEYTTNYTNEVIITFSLEDISDNDKKIEPDHLILHLNDSLIPIQYYSFTMLNDLIKITINTNSLGLSIGNYILNITVLKDHFIESISKEYTDKNFSVRIIPIETEIQMVRTYSEVNYNSQISIEFRFIDTNHSTYITGASFEASIDNSDVELVSLSEIDGLYSISLQIYEPAIENVNVTLSISKEGYNAKINFQLASIQLSPKPTLPYFIFILVGFIVLIAISIIYIQIVRRKKQDNKKIEKEVFEKTYAIYRSILAISKIIIVHEFTSLPVFEMDLGSGIEQDSSLISGFFEAISQIGSEMKGDEAQIRSINYQNFIVTRLKSNPFVLYAFADNELETEIENQLQELGIWFSNKFDSVGRDWEGSTIVFKSENKVIIDKIKELLYLWTLYPFKVSPTRLHDIKKLDSTSKKIIRYIMEKKQSTLSMVIDELDKIPIERSLVLIFDLMNNNYLEPLFDAYVVPIEKQYKD